MLKRLLIKNLILIDACEIFFSEGFNVITGETGAGKTAFIQALSLLLGEKADPQAIRKGESQAVIEAQFSILNNSAFFHLLEDLEIDLESKDEICIRKEIKEDGRSRNFINDQMVPNKVLKELGGHLIEIVGQNSQQVLRSRDAQRELLDLFGDHDLGSFQSAYRDLNHFKTSLELLENEKHRAQKEIELCQFQLEEIQSLSLKPDEEDSLNAEYSRLENASYLTEQVGSAFERLEGGLLSELSTLEKQISSLIKIDAKFEPVSGQIKSVKEELKELAFFLRNYLDHIEVDESRLKEISSKIDQIERLKKKYGKSLGEISAYGHSLQSKIDDFENLDAKILETKSKISSTSALCNQKADQLTLARKMAASKLAEELQKNLSRLNLNEAKIFIEVQNGPRSINGDDAIEFYLEPNPGEKAATLREQISGGELSRIYLAVKWLLADKQKTSILVFDEIDANIGGKTASLIGEALGELGKKKQLFCITHFPQVAMQAHRHICMRKSTLHGRTFTTAKPLEKSEKEEELLRMMGGLKMQA